MDYDCLTAIPECEGECGGIPCSRPMTSYHNTNDETGPRLARSQRAAATQEERVASWFRLRPHAAYTAPEVMTAVLPYAPLTSTRRALSNLTRRGILEKTAQKRDGGYGHDVYCWQLRQDDDLAAQLARWVQDKFG